MRRPIAVHCNTTAKTGASKAATLTQIRRARRYIYDYQAIEPGTATTAWYANNDGRRMLIGSGHLRVADAGHDKLELDLTSAGRHLLDGAKHVSVTATARFAPHGHRPAQVANSHFTLS